MYILVLIDKDTKKYKIRQSSSLKTATYVATVKPLGLVLSLVCIQKFLKGYSLGFCIELQWYWWK